MEKNIRVLQVVTHMNRGGLETMLMNYYRQIDHAHIQFDFLTHREYDGDYGEEIKKDGGKIYHLPALNPFSRTYRKELRKFFDGHPEYQIVHVHQDCLSSVILKEAKKHKVKVRIAHCHNSDQDKNFKYIVKVFYKQFISKYATDLIACGEDSGKWMFNGAQFQVINNAIDAKKYAYNFEIRNNQRAKWNIKNNEVLIGHVGRFSKQKNHEFIIDIFFELQKRINAKLILVGEGDLQNQIKEKVNNLGIMDKVIFTGLRSDVSDLLQAMDVFFFPSLYEGLPVVMIEAQASGLPCLISDRVPIECKKTDLVYQIPLDSDSIDWVDKIIKLSSIERKNTTEEIKKEGFDIEENAKKLVNFYIKKVVE